MTTEVVDVVVIGGGPAGLMAALEAAGAGARTILVDDSHRLGGNFYKMLPSGFRHLIGHTTQDPDNLEFRRMSDDLPSAGVRVLGETTVWGVFRGNGPTFSLEDVGRIGAGKGTFSLALSGPDPVETLEASAIILAPGAYDRTAMFPGWTLPGVITPGGTQLLLKNQGILIGKRILVAGTGPLLPAVAAALADHGAQVVGVLETSGALAAWGSMPGALWGQWGRIREGIGYGLMLARHRVPIHFRHAVFRAVGRDHVESATIGRVDGGGYPIPGTERTVEVDTICVGYGFLPSTALTRHLGCRHIYNADLRTHFPAHSKTMETSVPGVYVAGDVTGLGGKELARLQGRVAGLAASGALGMRTWLDVEQQISQLKGAISSEQRFGRMLWRRFRALPGLINLLEDDTIVCRCEAVDAGTIRAAIRGGERHIAAVKHSTRVGMGSCQGRYCTHPTGEILTRETEIPLEEQAEMSVRPPILPVRARDML